MIYLRVIEFRERHATRTRVDIYDGNVEEDREYWKVYHNAKARYFKLKEVKENEI